MAKSHKAFSTAQRRILLGLGLGLAPVAVMAAGGVSAADAFRMVFGVDSSSLASIMANTQETLIGTVSSVINLVALTAAVFAMLLTFFTGLAQSAHEGKVLGQRYSSLWVPLRAVLGLGFLTPLPGGYSMLQAIVLWIASLGSGFADQAANGGVVYMARDTAPAVIMSNATSGRSTLNALFAAALCAARTNQVAAEAREQGASSLGVRTNLLPVSRVMVYPSAVTNTGGGSGNDPPTMVLRGGVSYDGVDGLASSKGVCGVVTIERNLSLRGTLNAPIMASFGEQVTNLHRLANTLDGFAAEVVAGTLSMSEVRRRLLAFEGEFARDESRRVQSYAAQAGAQLQAAKGLALRESTDGGWLNLGAYYMKLSRSIDAAQSNASADVNALEARVDQMPAALREDLAPYRTFAQSVLRSSNATGAVNPADAAAGVSAVGAGENASPGLWDKFTLGVSAMSESPEISTDIVLASIKMAFTLMGQKLFQIFDEMDFSAGKDPIFAMSSAAHAGLLGLELVAVAPLALAIITGGSVIGIGAAMTILSLLIPTLFAIGAPLMMLAYYLPMIPYIYWTFGVLAWVLMMIEAVAIAPLWAAAHVMPEGEGLAGQHAKQGWMLMISLLVRPILMVMGFYAAVLVMRFMSLFIGMTFDLMWDSNNSGVLSSTFGPLSFLAYFFAMAGLMIAAAKATFSLIYEVPNRALRWLGGGESLGDFGGLETARSTGTMIAAGALAVVGANSSQGFRKVQGVVNAQIKDRQKRGAPGGETTGS